METCGNGLVKARYLRGGGLLAQQIDGSLFHYLLDGHGNVVQRIGPDGNAAPVYRYDAFGNQRDPVDTDPNPFRYCGEYHDAETGEIYLRNRSYAARTGRFTSEDPARDGMNWYTYCAGNPVAYADPMGLAPGIGPYGTGQQQAINMYERYGIVSRNLPRGYSSSASSRAESYRSWGRDRMVNAMAGGGRSSPQYTVYNHIMPYGLYRYGQLIELGPELLYQGADISVVDQLKRFGIKYNSRQEDGSFNFDALTVEDYIARMIFHEDSHPDAQLGFAWAMLNRMELLDYEDPKDMLYDGYFMWMADKDSDKFWDPKAYYTNYPTITRWNPHIQDVGASMKDSWDNAVRLADALVQSNFDRTEFSRYEGCENIFAKYDLGDPEKVIRHVNYLTGINSPLHVQIGNTWFLHSNYNNMT